MKTYTPIMDSNRIILDNDWEHIRQDKITEQVIFKKRDLVDISECDCCFKLIYTFKNGNQFWRFEKADLNCVADFNSKYAETRPEEITLN